MSFFETQCSTASIDLDKNGAKRRLWTPYPKKWQSIDALGGASWLRGPCLTVVTLVKLRHGNYIRVDVQRRLNQNRQSPSLGFYETYTVNRQKMFFLIYSLRNLTDCDRIWYILSWVNLSYRNVNVFCLTWIMSLPYLVKLSICILQVKSS